MLIAMTLSEYLERHGLTYAAFADQIGVGSGAVVHRYANGVRMPRPKIMKRIVEESGGEVQPGDFYRSKEAAA